MGGQIPKQRRRIIHDLWTVLSDGDETNSEPQKQKTDFAAYKSYPLKDNNFIIMDRYEKGWSFLFIL